MGSIIGALVLRGWSEKAAKLIAYGGFILLLFGALGGIMAYLEHKGAKQYVQKVEKRAAPATAKASNERVADALKNAKHEEELHNAVHSVPDAAPAGPSHALACARLKRAYPPEKLAKMPKYMASCSR